MAKERSRKALGELLQRPGNAACADCTAPGKGTGGLGGAPSPCFGVLQTPTHPYTRNRGGGSRGIAAPAQQQPLPAVPPPPLGSVKLGAAGPAREKGLGNRGAGEFAFPGLFFFFKSLCILVAAW